MLEYGDRLTSAQNTVQHVLQFSGADGFILQTHWEECKTYCNQTRARASYATTVSPQNSA